MAVHRRIQSIAYAAGQDLSSYQFRVVKMSSDGQIDPVENDDTVPLGVLLNKPNAAGAGAEVAIEGSEVKVVAMGAIEEGDLVKAGAAGMVEAGPTGGTAVGTAWILGVCTQPAAGSASVAGVLIRPFFYVRA